MMPRTMKDGLQGRRQIAWDHLEGGLTCSLMFGRGLGKEDDNEDRMTVAMTTQLRDKMLAGIDRRVAVGCPADTVTFTVRTRTMCLTDKMHIQTTIQRMTMVLLEECHGREVAIYHTMMMEQAVRKPVLSLSTVVVTTRSQLRQQLPRLIQVTAVAPL